MCLSEIVISKGWIKLPLKVKVTETQSKTVFYLQVFKLAKRKFRNLQVTLDLLVFFLN